MASTTQEAGVDTQEKIDQLEDELVSATTEHQVKLISRKLKILKKK